MATVARNYFAFETPPGPAYDEYAGPLGIFIRSPYFVDARYVGFVQWVQSTGAPANQRVQRLMLFGARTVGTDLPTTGSGSYAGQTLVLDQNGGRATITLDFARRTVTVSTVWSRPLTGNAGSGINAPPPTPITMTGEVDPASGRIRGVVRVEGGGADGTFEGALYGPRGAEAGLVFSVVGAFGVRLNGLVLAR